MAAELDEMADGFRNRRLDAGPYTFAWIDALTQKVREGGRTVNVHCLIATGVNSDGYREIPGVDVASSGDGAGWLAFLRGLAACVPSGVDMAPFSLSRATNGPSPAATWAPRYSPNSAKPARKAREEKDVTLRMLLK